MVSSHTRTSGAVVGLRLLETKAWAQVQSRVRSWPIHLADIARLAQRVEEAEAAEQDIASSPASALGSDAVGVMSTDASHEPWLPPVAEGRGASSIREGSALAIPAHDVATPISSVQASHSLLVPSPGRRRRMSSGVADHDHHTGGSASLDVSDRLNPREFRHAHRAHNDLQAPVQQDLRHSAGRAGDGHGNTSPRPFDDPGMGLAQAAH